MQSEFPLNALVLASEALRIANQNTGLDYFSWTFVSEDGQPVRASNGMWFGPDTGIRDMPDAEVILLFEGNLPTQLNSPKLLGPIRSAARHGTVVGGVDTGAFALAEAGVIGATEELDVVLHWEAVPSFAERYPEAILRDQIYMINEREAHSAGGVATLDMVLELIGRYRGQALANEVANALVHTRRTAAAPQRGSGLPEDEGDSMSRQLVHLIEDNLEYPLTLTELAEELEVSQRTLTRISVRAFGQPPMRLYMSIRLQSARNFLFYDDFSIREVALACGFSYAAVFFKGFSRGSSASLLANSELDFEHVRISPFDRSCGEFAFPHAQRIVVGINRDFGCSFCSRRPRRSVSSGKDEVPFRHFPGLLSCGHAGGIEPSRARHRFLAAMHARTWRPMRQSSQDDLDLDAFSVIPDMPSLRSNSLTTSSSAMPRDVSMTSR